MKRAALAAFGVAAVAGLALAATTSWWLLAVGVASIAAAWGYTGGPRPYGYLGLGEVFVFVFFGLVATVGTTYVAVETITGAERGDGVRGRVPGLRAAGGQQPARHPDRRRRRQAHARRAPRRRRGRGGCTSPCSRAAFVLVVVGGVVWRPAALLGLGALPLAVPPVRAVRGGAAGRGADPVLGATGRLQLAFGLLTTIGLALGA